MNHLSRFMRNQYMTKLNSKLQYVSDLHLEKGFKRVVKAEKPYLLLGGDIGHVNDNYKDFLHDVSNSFEKVFLISGNHEYDNSPNMQTVDEKIQNICESRNNLFFLQKKTHKIDEKLHITGCTFWATLPASKYEYHIDHQKWLMNTLKDNPNKLYIVATHHAPLFECLNSIKNRVSNYFATDQSNIIRNKNLLCWIHGHTHINKEFEFQNRWILTNQYGSFEKPGYRYK